MNHINRRTFLKGLGAVSSLAAFPGLSCAGASKPNFVFFLIDDLGWKDLGCFGSSFYETPNVDRLAAEGMRFSNAYAACQVCSPTRASIMAGKYPARMNTTDWFGAPQPDDVQNHWTRNKPLLPASYNEHLPLDNVTIAEALKEAGYQTFYAGKWHLGGEGYLPGDQGFDFNKGGHHRGSPPGGYFSPYNNPKLKDGPKGEHLPARLAEESVNFIEYRDKDKPFLLYLSFYSVHIPLQARDDLKEKYQTKAENTEYAGPRFIPEVDREARQVQDHAVYGGMVEAMDLAVGEVLDALQENGLDSNTIILFMSDNGGLSTSEGSPTANVPLRGGKGWIYEGGLRDPMIIKWPGHTRPGSVNAEPVISTDFYPTILEMAGLPLRPEQHMDGLSLVPLLKERGSLDRDAIYWHYPHYGNQGGTPNSAVRSGDWKLIHFYEDDSYELYNLRKDIGEHYNVVELYPERAKELKGKLEAWLNEVEARFPMPNPNHQ